MRPSLSNTFIWGLSIYRFLCLTFFGKNVLECASLVVEPRLQGRGDEKPALPPHLGSPAAAGGSLAHDLRFWSHCSFCFCFLKKKPMEPRSGRLSGPLPPPSTFLFFLLCSLSGFVSNFAWTFLEGVFLSPDLYCKLVRKRHEHGRTRDGEARPASQRSNSGLRRCRKVKALF